MLFSFMIIRLLVHFLARYNLIRKPIFYYLYLLFRLYVQSFNPEPANMKMLTERSFQALELQLPSELNVLFADLSLHNSSSCKNRSLL